METKNKRKLVKSAGEIHYQNMQKQYPFKELKDPWPLCGLISEKRLPRFTEDRELTCEKCEYLDNYYRENAEAVGQLNFGDL